MVVANLTQNARTAQRVIADTVARLPIERTCGCADALATAIITRSEAIPDSVKAELAPIIGRYM
jgi:5'-methylthioadenosine phosphorylase